MTSLDIARAIFGSLYRTPKYGKFLSGQVAKGATLLRRARAHACLSVSSRSGAY
jgi:hypothetical protein